MTRVNPSLADLQGMFLLHSLSLFTTFSYYQVLIKIQSPCLNLYTIKFRSFFLQILKSDLVIFHDQNDWSSSAAVASVQNKLEKEQNIVSEDVQGLRGRLKELTLGTDRSDIAELKSSGLQLWNCGVQITNRNLATPEINVQGDFLDFWKFLHIFPEKTHKNSSWIFCVFYVNFSEE